MDAAEKVLAALPGDCAALWAALEAADASLLPTNARQQPLLFCQVLVEALLALERRQDAAQRRRSVLAIESFALRLAGAAMRGRPETARLPAGDAEFFRSAFVRALERLLAEAGDAGDRELKLMAVMEAARLATLLASLWLLEDRAGNADRAAELLVASVEFLRRLREGERGASGPLFLLGMIQLAERAEKKRAMELLREAAALQTRAGEDLLIGCMSRGVVNYWLAVALFLNGQIEEAAAALKVCVRANYEPVACLMLSALLHLKSLDYQEASDELQRALEIDFSQSVSMFNYSVLLGRLGSFDSQAQMLQFFCESISEPENTLGGTKKRQRENGFWTADRGDDGESIVDLHKLDDVLLTPSQQVSMRLVHLHLALAMMETGAFYPMVVFCEALFTYIVFFRP